MDARHLFQLGTTDLGSGTAQTEGTLGWRATSNVIETRDTDYDDANREERERYPEPYLTCGNTEQDHFIRKNGKVYAGTHLIIEVIGGEGLDERDRIEQAMRDCVDACGATLLHLHLHKFSPQGVSGVAVLAESHISVHTWPEKGYGAFDVFMCGDAEPQRAVEVLRAAFNAADVQVEELLRGDGIV